MTRLIKDIKIKQNPQEFWSKYFSHIFVPYISAFLIKCKVNPNIITLLMIPSSFLCLYFSIFIFNKDLNLFLISLVGVCINIIDCVDGTVARHSNKVSSYGKYLDRICHYVTNPIIFLAYGISAIQVEKNLTGFLFFLITIIDLFDTASKDCLPLIKLRKDKFSYGKSRKYTFSFSSIANLIIRVFFLPLTCIPHIIFLFFPLFIYFDKLLLVYALLFLVVSISRLLIRSTNIRKKYESKNKIKSS